jgi:alanine racemase
MRPLSVCIDTQALKNNLNIVKKFSPNSKIMAVLKANAYGHGLIECARNLNPIDGIAVLNLSEAIDLREHGFEHKILQFLLLKDI